MQSAYSKFKLFNLLLYKQFANHQKKFSFIDLTNFFKRINLRRTINQLNNKKGLVSLAACSVFTWDDHRITNNEIKTEINEILKVFEQDNTEIAKKNFNRINFEASRQFEVIKNI